MPNPAPSSKTPPAPPVVFAPWAGILSYLIPGLGQICQGRIGKGLLFFFCLYGMFFYGSYLGDWKNVHLPDAVKNNKAGGWPVLLSNLYNRPQFLGQFWIGIAAWPALWQYNHLPVPSFQTSPFWHNYQRTPPESNSDIPADYDGKSLNQLQSEGDKTWDLGWVYTVIAGVLNVMVIYDAVAGPAFALRETEAPRLQQEGVPA